MDDQTTQAVIEIHDWISQNLKREADTHINRASAASNCVKQRWFKGKGYPQEPMQPRSILVFATGDVVEHVFKYFIELACVGPGKLYEKVDFGEQTGTFTIQHREFKTYSQESVYTMVNDTLKITGHADGWGKRNSDGKWELIEIKSSSNYGYDEFVNGKVPDYIKQAHALMMSDKALILDVKQVRFFYMKKETSHIFDRMFEFDEALGKLVKEEFVIAYGEKEPARPYDAIDELYYKKPTGRKVLDWKCGYCPYKKECYKNLTLEISRSGKPIWIVNEKN